MSQPTIETAHGNRTGRHLCPWWVGYLLASPVRRILENPKRLLSPHVRPGMTVLDLGSAMGFFSLPLARMVGSSGRVVCVDVQERMLRTLEKRARRRGLDDVIELRTCTQDSLGLDDLRGTADLALAFHVVHETANPDRFFADCYEALKPGGKLLWSEPSGHVSDADRAFILDLAVAAGFVQGVELPVRKSKAMVLEKRGA